MNTHAFKSIISSGHISVGDANVNRFVDFNLSRAPVNSAAALLFMTARDVDWEKSFVTINMSNAVPPNIHYNNAKLQNWFVTRIFSTDRKYITTIHRIKPGVLVDGANSFGVHARTQSGHASGGNIDDFVVARVFINYTTNE